MEDPSGNPTDDSDISFLQGRPPGCPPVRYQVPLFQQQSVLSFSLAQGLNPGMSSSPSHPVAGLKAEPENMFLSHLGNYMELGQDARLGSTSAGHGHSSFEALLKTVGSLPPAPPMSRSSPEALLDVICLVQSKLRHLESIVRGMVLGGRHPGTVQQQQLLSTEFTSTMSQLFAAASGFTGQSCQFWPPASQGNDAFDFSFDGFNDEDMNTALGGIFCPPSICNTMVDATSSAMKGDTDVCAPAPIMDPGLVETGPPTSSTTTSSEDAANLFASVGTRSHIGDSSPSKGTPSGAPENGNNQGMYDVDAHVSVAVEESREDDDDGDGEILPPGSYELVELAATEILAEHTHFCEICSKGFKRDANLRMHMRGHGDEYKTPAALARPDKTPRDPSMAKLRRYSCPYAGCKRNRKHPKFQPLKTMLCVKNHYRRSHCPKLLICSRCKTKKFSVVADLKTHEKHCGQDKWQCSCGTTFSRKDKLFGHIGLFVGHTPATPIPETESAAGGGEEATPAGFLSRSGEEPASTKADSLGLGGTSANTVQEEAMASYVSVSHGMDQSDLLGMHRRNEGSSEQSIAYRDKNLPFLNRTGSAMIGDASYPMAGLTYDVSKLRNLLSDSCFNQVDSMT